MSAQASPWLPPAPQEAVADCLSQWVRDWTADWFATAPACRAAPCRPLRGGSVEWLGCAGAAAGAPDGDLAALGQAALVGSADADNARDGEILAEIGRQALSDLASSLCRLAEHDAPAAMLSEAPAGEAGEFYTLAGGGWSIATVLDPATQVRLRRQIAGTQRRPSPARLVEALAPEVVSLGCHLGRASLPAAEVAALARGDLIVLDRRTTDRLPLTVEGTIASRGQASVETQDGAVAIRIAEPIDLTARSD